MTFLKQMNTEKNKTLRWHFIHSEADIDTIIEQSHTIPCAIFKHSTRCSTSDMAKSKLERHWIFHENQVQMFFLDLIAHRSISNKIAEVFNVYHESPQLLLIKNGEVVYDDSHIDINITNLEEALTEN